MVTSEQNVSDVVILNPKRTPSKYTIGARIARAKRKEEELAVWQASDNPPLWCTCCKAWKDRAGFASYLVSNKRYFHKRCNRCRTRRYVKSDTCLEKRAFLDGLKRKPCPDCGVDHPPHIRKFWCTTGKPKWSLNQSWSGRSLKAIKAEAQRHVALCLNCFGIKAFNRSDTSTPKHSKLAELAPEHFRRDKTART